MFIVLEGIDGAGKGRQRMEMTKILKGKGISVDGVEFPDHQGVLYKQLIKPYLMEQIKLNKESLFISFALDQLLFQDRIKDAKGSRKDYFLVDGYFTTNIVYQCLVNKLVDLDIALSFAKDFEIQEADINFFINVDPKVALMRKSKEPGHEQGLDINERDIKKQYEIQKSFLYLAKNKIFGKWEVIDGNGSIKEVSDLLLKAFKKFKLV